ncbi:type II secretion system protein [Achromobacter seleniivolatilans]|uniref:Type II secretion system protein n=1 Tax=Achromobacter seleniivolatilans TaxID=3047478 RepID=A0ABY9LV12_9BURK|nr:type II secretion system protein [Achromobacter sp. R39]WMD18295.1 type II secretion system protein [Achromobacter sp. R39]
MQAGSGRPRARQTGVAYLTVLMLVLAVATGLSAMARPWALQMQRQQESELLFAGQQFQRALASYYRSGTAPAYPKTLEALLKDDRVSFTRRHLRRIYVDPITGTREWGIVKSPDGGIMGVYSLSEKAPVKQDGFPGGVGDMAGKGSYQDWKFVFMDRP